MLAIGVASWIACLGRDGRLADIEVARDGFGWFVGARLRTGSPSGVARIMPLCDCVKTELAERSPDGAYSCRLVREPGRNLNVPLELAVAFDSGYIEVHTLWLP